MPQLLGWHVRLAASWLEQVWINFWFLLVGSIIFLAYGKKIQGAKLKPKEANFGNVFRGCKPQCSVMSLKCADHDSPEGQLPMIVPGPIPLQSSTRNILCSLVMLIQSHSKWTPRPGLGLHQRSHHGHRRRGNWRHRNRNHTWRHGSHRRRRSFDLKLKAENTLMGRAHEKKCVLVKTLIELELG